MSEINEANKSLLSSLEKRGLLEMTKAYFRTNLIESLNKDDFYKTAPLGFNNLNQKIIKDPKIISILRLQYSLINDFLIRTKMTYTQNILSNEIKSLLENNIPLTDSEIIRILNLNIKQISNSRLNSNLKSGPNDLIKNTYLYHLINLHSNLTKIDGEAQTLFFDDKNKKSNKAIDLEKELRKIDEKYNNIIDINKIVPFNKLNEKKFLEYKEECDNKYKEDLKSEMERFKNNEISQMRLDENKNYVKKIEKIREEYEQMYEKKNEEIQNMKKLLEEKEKMLEKEQDKKILENNEIIISQLKKIREDSEQRINQYINEIDKINNEKALLEQTIENMKEKFDLDLKSQISKIKNNYMEQLATEKSLLKEESEREKKIMINNYTNRVYRKESLEENKNNNANININNNSIYLKNSNFSNKKLAEDFHNRRKRIEEIDEEQERINKMKYEFKDIINEHVPIVLLNQEEIDQIKNNNEYINNALLNEKKENQRKKSANENWNNNINNTKEIKSPYRNNNSILNNNKNLVINNQIRSNNMGIPSANIFNNANLNNTNKKSSGVIEENLDFENISSSQKSKELSNKKSGNIVMNNINTSNFGSNKKSIFPPINNNMSYSIKEEINISANKTKSRIGSSGKKNIENNNFINNKSSKKNNEEDDEYGEGDFENNISSFNQASDKKQIKFGKIKNQNEKLINIQEKIDKSNVGNNKDEVEESYNDFDNTKGLINKGVNFEGSSGFYNNNMSKFNNNMNINNKKNNDESEIKEDIEYDSNNEF
jgi:hypothetical protein